MFYNYRVNFHFHSVVNNILNNVYNIYYYSLFRDGDNNIQEKVDAAAMSAVQE